MSKIKISTKDGHFIKARDIDENNLNSIKPVLISAFSGTGKSFFFRKYYNDTLHKFSVDIDSSGFHKSNFPQNYIKAIKEKISQGYVLIFISTHKDVRNGLLKKSLDFTLVYPKKKLKEEYLRRYKQRGSSERFINLMADNWDSWIDELKEQKGCNHIELESGQFIEDLF